MSKEQDLKQEQNNLVHTYGLLSLRMEEVQSQARQIEQQMINTKKDIRENIEKQNEETTEIKEEIVKEEVVEEEISQGENNE